MSVLDRPAPELPATAEAAGRSRWLEYGARPGPAGVQLMAAALGEKPHGPCPTETDRSKPKPVNRKIMCPFFKTPMTIT